MDLSLAAAQDVRERSGAWVSSYLSGDARVEIEVSPRRCQVSAGAAANGWRVVPVKACPPGSHGRAGTACGPPRRTRASLNPMTPSGSEDSASLSSFSCPRVRSWFQAAFAGPTPAQAKAWPAIAGGEHVLVSAPTGSGKTLAAFLWALDRLSTRHARRSRRRHRVVYVSPLKALAYDIERNLRAPIRGIAATEGTRRCLTSAWHPHRRHAPARARGDGAQPAGHPDHDPRVALSDPHLPGAGDARGVEAVIVDEIHAVAHSKRGSHLALTLSAWRPRPPVRCSGSASARPSVRSRRSGATWSAPPAGQDRRCGCAEEARAAHRGAGGVDDRTRRRAAPSATTRWRRRPPEPASRARGTISPRSTPSCSSASGLTTRPSCSSTTAARPSAWPCD